MPGRCFGFEMKTERKMAATSEKKSQSGLTSARIPSPRSEESKIGIRVKSWNRADSECYNFFKTSRSVKKARIIFRINLMM